MRVLSILAAVLLAACGPQAPAPDAAPPAATTPPAREPAAPAPAGATASFGTIAKVGHTLRIQDVVATWSQAEGELVVHLLPTRLSAQSRAALLTGEPFSVLSGLPSPDPARWQWYPFATLTIVFEPGTAPSLETADRMQLILYGIAENNGSDSFHRIDGLGDAVQAIQVSAGADGKRLQLAATGSDGRTGSSLRWDLGLKGVPIVGAD